MALGLILILYVILKAGEIYLLTISKTESDQISKRKVSAADSLFNSIYQLSAFFVTAISVLVFVIFGNGMGRNFLFRNLKKQANHSAKKRKKMEHGLIETVPLQTEKEPENIWN